MPIFSIKCNDCSAIEEVLVQRASDKSPKCPKCGSANTQRMVSRAAVRTGGNGGGACPTGTCPFTG